MSSNNNNNNLDHPPWEDVLLYSISIDTRKRFEEAVQIAKAERRKNASLGDDYIFHSGNKVALPKEEFCDFFRRLLLKGYWILQREKEKANEDNNNAGLSSFSSSFRRKDTNNNNDHGSGSFYLDDDDNNDNNQKGSSSSSHYKTKSGTPNVSILATALQQMNSQAHHTQSRQQQQASKSQAMMNSINVMQQSQTMNNPSNNINSNASFRGNNNNQPESFTATTDIFAMNVKAIERDPQMRNIIRSIDRFLSMFFIIADAEKGGRLDWDRTVTMIEEVISAGGIRNLAGNRFDIDGNPLLDGKNGTSTSDPSSMLMTNNTSGTFGDAAHAAQSGTFAPMTSDDRTKSSAFLDEMRAANEHEQNIGLACASMRVLRVMRFVGERNRTILPSAATQLQMIKTRLKDAEITAALTNRVKDPVQSVIEPYRGAPPIRGEFGGSILGPPPMYNTEAKQLRTPICNMNQSRILLDTPYESSLEVTCPVQPFAASAVTRLTYQPSTGLFSALCKETNEVRFVGESQAFLQKLALKDESKIESVSLWKTVAASKAMSQGAGSIFEACAYSCFLGLLDGTVQLYSLRDTRIGPGMRNISLRLQTRVPSGYVVCSAHVPHARPSSIFSGTSTGDLIHWNFDPHIVDDFTGGGGANGTEVTNAQAAALRKLMVFRRTIHDGPIMDLCRLGDVGVVDLSQIRHEGSANSSSGASVNKNTSSSSSSTTNDQPNASSSENNNQNPSAAGGTNSSNNSNTQKSSGHSDCSIVSVGFDGYACVSDVYSPSALRRFAHPAGLLCCTSITNSIFSSAGFVNEPHIWDVRAGSSTKPTMKLYDKRHPHVASITSLNVMSHLLPSASNSSSSSSKQNSMDDDDGADQEKQHSFLSPLVSCDSVGRMNVWDLRVGKTLSSFDIHDLIDDATEALPDQKKARNRSSSAGLGGRGSSSSNTASSSSSAMEVSLKDHKFSEDSCRATISRQTGRIFVTSESRSAVAEFGSVTPIGQDPRGCFPSEAILAIQYIPSLRVIVTCHTDVVIIWELSRTYESKHVAKQRKARDRARQRSAKMRQSIRAMYEKSMTMKQDDLNNNKFDFDPEELEEFLEQREDENVYEEDIENGGGGGSAFFDGIDEDGSGEGAYNDPSDIKNVEQCPFTVGELHEFLAPDIEAAAAQAARSKVLFKDKNSNKPPICHHLQPKERITAFCLHSRGNQYSIGTNQGRIFVCRIHGGEILFRTEKSVHPKANTEIRWIASASAPNVYSGLSSEGASERIGGLVSLSPTKKKKPQASFGFDGLAKSESLVFTPSDAVFEKDFEDPDEALANQQKKPPNAHLQTKTLLQDDTIVSIGSDDSVLCVHTMRQQIIQIYPKGHPLQCRVSSHDALAVLCDDSPFFYSCDPLVASTVPIIPKPEHRHHEASSPMTAMTIAPWLNVAFLGDSCGVIHCYAVKPHILAEAGSDAHLYAATFESGDANVDLSKVNPNAPAISTVQCHHVGSQTMQEFTLVVAGDDVGRVGWWRAMGEIEVVGEKQRDKINRRRSSLGGGSLLSPTLASTTRRSSSAGGGFLNASTSNNSIPGRPTSASSSSTKKVTGKGRISFVTSDNNNNNNDNDNATLSQFTFGSSSAPNQNNNNDVPFLSSNEQNEDDETAIYTRTRRLSSTGSAGNNNHEPAPQFYVKPSLYWENSVKYHEGRIVGLSIFTKHDTDLSGLAALWIAAAGSDGRVSIIRASTGEFISLLSASPAARLASLTSAAKNPSSAPSSSSGNSKAEQQQQISLILQESGSKSGAMMSAKQRQTFLTATGGQVGGGVFAADEEDGPVRGGGATNRSVRGKRALAPMLSASSIGKKSRNAIGGGGGGMVSFLNSAVSAEMAAKSWMGKSGIVGGKNLSSSSYQGSSAASFLGNSQRRAHDPSKLFEGTKRHFSMNTLFWMRRFMHNCRRAVKKRKDREEYAELFRDSHTRQQSFTAFGEDNDDHYDDENHKQDDHDNNINEMTFNNTMSNNTRSGGGLGATFGRRFSAALGAFNDEHTGSDGGGAAGMFSRSSFTASTTDEGDDDHGGAFHDSVPASSSSSVSEDHQPQRVGTSNFAPSSSFNNQSSPAGLTTRKKKVSFRQPSPGNRSDENFEEEGASTNTNTPFGKNNNNSNNVSFCDELTSAGDSSEIPNHLHHHQQSPILKRRSSSTLSSSAMPVRNVASGMWSQDPQGDDGVSRTASFGTFGEAPTDDNDDHENDEGLRSMRKDNSFNQLDPKLLGAIRQKRRESVSSSTLGSFSRKTSSVAADHHPHQQHQNKSSAKDDELHQQPAALRSRTRGRVTIALDPEDEDTSNKNPFASSSSADNHAGFSRDDGDTTAPPSLGSSYQSLIPHHHHHDEHNNSNNTSSTVDDDNRADDNFGEETAGQTIRFSDEASSPLSSSKKHKRTDSRNELDEFGSANSSPIYNAMTISNLNSTATITASTISRSPYRSMMASSNLNSTSSNIGPAGSSGAHFGQTVGNLGMSTQVLAPAPPIRTKITYEEMKQRHKFRTMRAAGILPHEDEDDQEMIAHISRNNDNNSPVRTKSTSPTTRSIARENNNNSDDSPSYNIQTGALLAGPIKLGVEFSQLSPTDKDREDLEIFDGTQNSSEFIYNDNHETDYEDKENEDHDVNNNQQVADFENKEKTNSQRRNRNTKNRHHSPNLDHYNNNTNSYDNNEQDNDDYSTGDNNKNNSRKPSPERGSRPNSAATTTHHQHHPRQTQFIHLSTQRKVPNRPTSAKVENIIKDVVSNRFLLPESRERLGRRFAQSVVVSTSQRSYVPVSAESVSQNSTSLNRHQQRPLSARVVTMRASNSRYNNNNNNNNNNNSNQAPPSAPTVLSAATNSTLYDMNIVTDIASASSRTKGGGSLSPTSASLINQRPQSAKTATSSPQKISFGSSARARNHARHHGEREQARSLTRPASAMSTTSNSSQQQQHQIKLVVEKIVNDPDSDMSTKIQPPSNGNGEVSARRAADVLHHTSARTNELVQRKAAVENEAKRYRFKYDVESRKKRDLLLNRVGKMGGCIDDALTPTTLNNLGLKSSSNNNSTIVSSSPSDPRPSSAKNISKTQNLHAGRNWVPPPELVNWMSAPKSMAK